MLDGLFDLLYDEVFICLARIVINSPEQLVTNEIKVQLTWLYR